MSLFRNHPALALGLLQGALGVEVPVWSEAKVESSEFTQVVTTEYRADLVVVLRERNGKPVFAIVIEVQLSRSQQKRKSWPVYLTTLKARLGCPAVLLVVAPEQGVARWCARPIPVGHPGFVLQPLVAGPRDIPLIVGPQAAGQAPEPAVLSALAHGHDARLAPGLFEAVVSTSQRLDNEHFTFYVDLVLSAFSEAARRALEEHMQSGGYQYQSELVRKLVARGLEKGQKEGREEGRRQGREEGREEGRQEGHLEGERTALIKVLEARGLVVEGMARRRLLECTDQGQLERWLSEAVTVHSVQELLQSAHVSKQAARPSGSARQKVRARKPSVRR